MNKIAAPVYSRLKAWYHYLVIPVLVILYVLLIGLAAYGASLSHRLRRHAGLRFLGPFHVFILLSFAYALMNFIGEAFAPALFPVPSETLGVVHLLVDLVTIPLLALIFFFFYRWISRLQSRRSGTALELVFTVADLLFLAVFLVVFVSYFARGLSNVSAWGIFILNGLLVAFPGGAVLVLLGGASIHDDPGRNRLIHGLGVRYAIVFIILALALGWPGPRFLNLPLLARAVPPSLVFLVNFPALLFIRRSLKSRPPRPDPEPAAAEVPDGLAGISDREREIIGLVAQGFDNREIGRRLFISPKTVKNHITSIYAKTGAKNRVQLANLFNRPGGGTAS